MHMADALISPAVGGTMWAVTAALTAYSAKKLKESANERIAPLMGVLGAFIFAAQMINFTIPGTGSSGHLGGGMVLAILLGPYAAFLSMASILTVQALFFADGGLLALGCNIFNMAFIPCFLAYPLIYKKIAGDGTSRNRILPGAMAASIIGLQLGAFCVVAETVFSGVSGVPFWTFVFLMQPIHLAIGIVEGLATAAIVSFIRTARPETFHERATFAQTARISTRTVLAGFLAAAVITAAGLSWFASSNPDGLEWSISHATGKQELIAPQVGLHAVFARLQEKTALLPDYSFGGAEEKKKSGAAQEAWPAVNAGTSVSGLIGGAVTMLLAGVIGVVLRRFSGRA